MYSKIATPNEDLSKPKRLQSGHHGLSRDQVRASQRERILAALVDCVGAHGYASTSVGAVIGEAHVSRSAFYEQFTDKPDCFRVAYREMTHSLLGELATIGAGEPTLVEATRASVETYLGWCTERPAPARFWHLAVLALEPDGQNLRDEAVVGIERIFAAGAARARDEHGGLPPVRAFMFTAAIQATLAMTGGFVREDRFERMAELRGPLLYLWLVALTNHAVAEGAQVPIAVSGR